MPSTRGITVTAEVVSNGVVKRGRPKGSKDKAQRKAGSGRPKGSKDSKPRKRGSGRPKNDHTNEGLE